MIRRTIYAVWTGLLASCVMLLAGCRDDELMNTLPEVAEGVPVTATMNVSASPGADIVVNTRAGNDLSDLYDLTLFIFDGDGKFQHVVSTYDGTLKITQRTGSEVENKGTTHQVEFNTTSGDKMMLAMGNLFSSYWYIDGQTNIEILRKANNGEYSFEELENKVFKLSALTSDPNERPDFYMPVQMTASEQMMVSGCNEHLVIDTKGNVAGWGIEGSETDRVGIAMQRSMGRITFNIPEKPAGAKGEFLPTSYTVYNIPEMSYVVNSHSGTPKLTPQEEDGVEQRFIHYTTTNIPALSGGKYSFQFYMPENTYERVDGITRYAERDKWKQPEGVDAVAGATPLQKVGLWSNAPQTSTFVVIRGTYSGKADVKEGETTKENDVTADVSYTIHLGDFSDTGSMGDFSVKRNCSYTYNVSVLGVDNIVVEALVEGDEREPGAEGIVYDVSSMEYSYDLDAHYEQVFLEYNLSQIAETLSASLAGTSHSEEDIDNAIADQLVLVIQSEAMDHNADGVSNKRGTLRPYKIYADAVRGKSGADAENAAEEAKEEILAGAGSNGVPTKGYDYKWVEFWPQTATGIARYPGISEWAREDLTGLKNSDYYGDESSPSSLDRERLMDVYNVIVGMGKAVRRIYDGAAPSVGDTGEGIIVVSNDDGDYVARFTAFINEYYYLRHPLTGEIATTWSSFTNKIPRQMIIAISSSTSSDKNSSYGRIHSYISQLSMQTLYNSRVEALAAFGIETYNETPLTIKFGTPASVSGLDDSDGRRNQKILIGFQSGITSWDTYIDALTNGWTDSKNIVTDHVLHKLPAGAYSTQAAYAACLSRNRDLNGNRVIDENEVRWFLASVNGYIRMGMGANAISNAAQLYIGDKATMTFATYPDSDINDGALFYTSSASQKRLYWAVEKGAYGVDGETWTAGDDPKPIRCIRTLSVERGDQDISSLEGATSDAVYEEMQRTGADGRTTMNVLKFKDWLVDGVYRNRVGGSLNRHDEDDAENSFYEGIFVASADLADTYGLAEIIGYGSQTKTDPCNGYSEGGYDNWRVPNLVELTAMVAASNRKDGTNISLTAGTICCTQFSNGDVRYGFHIAEDSGSRLITALGGEKYDSGQRKPITEHTGKVIRCVRDVPVGYFD